MRPIRRRPFAVERRAVKARVRPPRDKKSKVAAQPAAPIAAEIAKALKHNPFRFPAHWI